MRLNGSPLAPGLAIVVQARELFSSSSPKSLALGPAITVQIKGHVSSFENSCSWFGHRGTNQGAYFISPKFLPLVRPLRYRLRCMFNLSQNFAFELAILVQTKEYVASIPKFCPWFGHRGTNQGACYIYPKLSPLAWPSRYESRSVHGSCKHGSFKCCVHFVPLISVLVRSL